MSEPNILQLVTKGEEDNLFLQNPELSFFKFSFKKYVNFATELYQIVPQENADFNKKISFQIPKKGDLLSDMYLYIKLPALEKVNGEYLSWSDSLGNCIFDDDGVNLEIDGVIIEKLYPRFMDMEYEFTSGTQKAGIGGMINKSDIYLSAKNNALRIYDLIIPLQFFFTKKHNLALPISSFNYKEMKITFKTRKFKQLINFDGDEPTDDVHFLDCSLYCEYRYFENSFIDEFVKQKHEFVIEQVQSCVYNIPPNTPFHNIALPFINPVKEIMFGVVETNNLNTNNYFVYQDQLSNPYVDKITFSINNKPKFNGLQEFVYRTIFPKKTHKDIPLKYIYVIPFALLPELSQPSGYLNFSKYDNTNIFLDMIPNSQELVVYIYAKSMNILTIENGSYKLSFFS